MYRELLGELVIARGKLEAAVYSVSGESDPRREDPIECSCLIHGIEREISPLCWVCQ
jgi:hypothetical protein